MYPVSSVENSALAFLRNSTDNAHGRLSDGKELVILEKRADRLEVALALAEQAEIAPQHIGCCNAFAGGCLDDPRAQRRESVDGQADQGHAGLRGVKFSVGLLNVEPRKRHEKISLAEFQSGSIIAEKTNKIS
jgi:hypothetical protein